MADEFYNEFGGLISSVIDLLEDGALACTDPKLLKIFEDLSPELTKKAEEYHGLISILLNHPRIFKSNQKLCLKGRNVSANLCKASNEKYSSNVIEQFKTESKNLASSFSSPEIICVSACFTDSSCSSDCFSICNAEPCFDYSQVPNNTPESFSSKSPVDLYDVLSNFSDNYQQYKNMYGNDSELTVMEGSQKTNLIADTKSIRQCDISSINILCGQRDDAQLSICSSRYGKKSDNVSELVLNPVKNRYTNSLENINGDKLENINSDTFTCDPSIFSICESSSSENVNSFQKLKQTSCKNQNFNDPNLQEVTFVSKDFPKDKITSMNEISIEFQNEAEINGLERNILSQIQNCELIIKKSINDIEGHKLCIDVKTKEMEQPDKLSESNNMASFLQDGRNENIKFSSLKSHQPCSQVEFDHEQRNSQWHDLNKVLLEKELNIKKLSKELSFEKEAREKLILDYAKLHADLKGQIMEREKLICKYVGLEKEFNKNKLLLETSNKFLETWLKNENSLDPRKLQLSLINAQANFEALSAKYMENRHVINNLRDQVSTLFGDVMHPKATMDEQMQLFHECWSIGDLSVFYCKCPRESCSCLNPSSQMLSSNLRSKRKHLYKDVNFKLTCDSNRPSLGIFNYYPIFTEKKKPLIANDLGRDSCVGIYENYDSHLQIKNQLPSKGTPILTESFENQGHNTDCKSGSQFHSKVNALKIQKNSESCKDELENLSSLISSPDSTKYDNLDNEQFPFVKESPALHFNVKDSTSSSSSLEEKNENFWRSTLRDPSPLIEVSYMPSNDDVSSKGLFESILNCGIGSTLISPSETQIKMAGPFSQANNSDNLKLSREAERVAPSLDKGGIKRFIQNYIQPNKKSVQSLVKKKLDIGALSEQVSEKFTKNKASKRVNHIESSRVIEMINNHIASNSSVQNIKKPQTLTGELNYGESHIFSTYSTQSASLTELLDCTSEKNPVQSPNQAGVSKYEDENSKGLVERKQNVKINSNKVDTPDEIISNADPDEIKCFQGKFSLQKLVSNVGKFNDYVELDPFTKFASNICDPKINEATNRRGETDVFDLPKGVAYEIKVKNSKFETPFIRHEDFNNLNLKSEPILCFSKDQTKLETATVNSAIKAVGSCDDRITFKREISRTNFNNNHKIGEDDESFKEKIVQFKNKNITATECIDKNFFPFLEKNFSNNCKSGSAIGSPIYSQELNATHDNKIRLSSFGIIVYVVLAVVRFKNISKTVSKISISHCTNSKMVIDSISTVEGEGFWKVDITKLSNEPRRAVDSKYVNKVDKCLNKLDSLMDIQYSGPFQLNNHVWDVKNSVSTKYFDVKHVASQNSDAKPSGSSLDSKPILDAAELFTPFDDSIKRCPEKRVNFQFYEDKLLAQSYIKPSEAKKDQIQTCNFVEVKDSAAFARAKEGDCQNLKNAVDFFVENVEDWQQVKPRRSKSACHIPDIQNKARNRSRSESEKVTSAADCEAIILQIPPGIGKKSLKKALSFFGQVKTMEFYPEVGAFNFRRAYVLFDNAATCTKALEQEEIVISDVKLPIMDITSFQRRNVVLKSHTKNQSPISNNELEGKYENVIDEVKKVKDGITASVPQVTPPSNKTDQIMFDYRKKKSPCLPSANLLSIQSSPVAESIRHSSLTNVSFLVPKETSVSARIGAGRGQRIGTPWPVNARPSRRGPDIQNCGNISRNLFVLEMAESAYTAPSFFPKSKKLQSLVQFLSTMFPVVPELELTQSISDVRQRNNNSLSGITYPELGRQIFLDRLWKTGADEGQCCLLCTELYVNSDTTVLVCFHSFHIVCLVGWRKFIQDCPVCDIAIKELASG